MQREPIVALDGGDDGLEPFRRLLAQAKDKVARGGVVVVELMPEQMEAAAETSHVISMPNLSAAADSSMTSWATSGR